MNKLRSTFIPVVFLAIVPTAFGQLSFCDRSGDLRFDGLKIENGKLTISVHWPAGTPIAAPATIETLDRKGTVIALSVVEPEPGKVISYPLTTDPTFFAENGYWYTFRIVDPLGENLAPTVSGLVSFCRGWESCVYKIVEGMSSESVSMSAELFELLDALESAGSRDLLHDALLARPDLDFEIYWVADQMVRLRADKTGTGCICQWHTEFELNPPAKEKLVEVGETPQDFELPDWLTYLQRGPGANLRIASQILGGKVRAQSVSGHGRVGLHLRCRATTAWTYTTWSGLALKVPTLDPCERICVDSRVEVTAMADIQAVANALATVDHGARGLALTSAALFLDQQSEPEFKTSVRAEADRAPGDFDISLVEDISGYQTNLLVLPGRDASATLSVQGQTKTCLADFGPVESCKDPFPRPVDEKGSWAYSCVTSTTMATLVGKASCALRPHQKAILRPLQDGTGTEDGLLFLPWRP